MCGRLSIDGFVLTDRVSAQFGIPYHPQTNLDLRPIEQVTVVGQIKDQFASINCTWGIKPNWSKYLLVNAQAETVREKKTLRTIAVLFHVLDGMSGVMKVVSKLIQGAWSIIRYASKSNDRISVWALKVIERRGKQKAAVAIANKLARIIWAMLFHHSEYRPC